jgi:hypothetical protein
MRTITGAGFSSAGKYKPDNSWPSAAEKKTSIGSGGRTRTGVAEGRVVGMGISVGRSWGDTVASSVGVIGSGVGEILLPFPCSVATSPQAERTANKTTIKIYM